MFSWIKPLFVATLNRGVLPRPADAHPWPEKEIVLGKREKVRINAVRGVVLETLKLSCRLVKIPLVDYDVTAQVYLGAEPLPSVRLYSSDVGRAAQSTISGDHLLKGVEFVWLGLRQEDQQYRIEMQDGKPLVLQSAFYIHEFRQQTAGHFTLTYQQLADGSLNVIPPGRPRGYPVWSYGGVMGDGGQIHLSEPVFFSLTMRQGKTYVDLVRSKVLRKAGVTYEKPVFYNNREIVVQEQEVTMDSLAEAVASGGIQIIVRQDNALPVRMQSVQLNQVSESVFALTFARKKS